MSTVATWPSQAETWLDERGKGAWIAAMVLGFIFVWPVGLAILAYMIWSKRMFSGSHAKRNHMSRCRDRYAARSVVKSSGNTAFDAYKSQTLRRLEEEQQNFESFLQRLRESKDKSEFDDFMDDRARKAREADDQQASGDETEPDKDPKPKA
ncbi:MAG: DUF2852 domain-containing protein [Paracoccaceae bacterium]